METFTVSSSGMLWFAVGRKVSASGERFTASGITVEQLVLLALRYSARIAVVQRQTRGATVAAIVETASTVGVEVVIW